MPLTLVRCELTGAAKGELAPQLPQPPERSLLMRILIKTALTILGLLSFVIMLSFMMPQKLQWLTQKAGVEETAIYLGLVPSKEGTSPTWSARSILATGTQMVRRFLGSAGRRF